MIGNIIQSYLVSLGVQIDKPGFQQADHTIRETGANIERVTSGMARNFVKASTIISSALAGVTASAIGLMKATANQDLAMQKYARSMMMSEDAAWRMKKATDALGESINDIALTPELLGRFNKLTADGAQMKVGGDFKSTMKDFRDLIFEFTRLKQEASYALNWVGYYLMKYLQKPLADIREKFKSFNDMVIKNMSKWTEKVARGIYYVIEVGRHFLEFIWDVGKHLKNLWDSFPKGAKIAIAAITAINVALAAGPLGRGIMLISTLLLLIDDYYGYMEGKDALLGKYWDKLNYYLEKANEWYEQLKKTAAPYWDMVVEYAQKAYRWISEVVGQIKEWAETSGKGLLDGFIAEVKDVANIIWELASAFGEFIYGQFRAFQEGLSRTDFLKDFTGIATTLWSVIKELWGALKNAVRFVTMLLRALAKNEAIKAYTQAIAELWAALIQLLKVVIEAAEAIGKKLFGQIRKTSLLYAFKNVLYLIFTVLSLVINTITKLISTITKLFKTVGQSKEFEKFWRDFGTVLDKVLLKLGKVAKTCALIIKGDWSAAKALWDKDDATGKDKPERITDATERQKRAWDNAKRVGAQIGIAPELLYGQWYHETGGFTSELAVEDNNFGGLTTTEDRGAEYKQPDGSLWYMSFTNMEEYADYYAKVWGPYIKGAQNSAQLARMLKEEGYYGADEDDYLAGIQNGMKNIPVDDEYLDKQASTNDKGEKIGRLAGEPENANKELQLRFLDAVSEMREYGYDFYVQSSSPNSIGFTSSAESEDDIRAVERYLASKGLSVSRDGHGFYVSLAPDRTNPTFEDYAQYGADTDKMWQKSAKDYFDDARIKPMNGLDGELMIEILKKAVTMPRDIMRPTSTASLADGNYQAGALGLATGKYQLSGTAGFMDTGKPSPLAQLYEMIRNLPKPNTDIIGGLLAQLYEMIRNLPKPNGLATDQYQTSDTSSFMDTGKPSPLAQLYEMIGNLPKPNTDIIGGLLAQLYEMIGNLPKPNADIIGGPLAQLYEMIGNLPKPNTDIIGGLLAGYHDYTGAGGNTQNINIDVGGITIQGEGKTNADVGRVAAETIGKELQRYANFHVNNTVVAGGPTLM